MHLVQPGVARFALLGVLVGALAMPRAVVAQQPSQPKPDSSRHQALQRELDSTSKALTDYRANRLQLAAQYDKVMAQLADERAHTLTLSTEQGSLHSLDSILVTAQSRLALQRERLKAVQKAVGSRDAGTMVVVFRAEPSARVEGAALEVDGSQTATRAYNDTSAAALRAGGADEIFRGSVLPVAHTLAFTASVNGRPVSETATVTAAADGVTYVQFDLRGGRLVQTAWRGPAVASNATSY